MKHDHNFSNIVFFVDKAGHSSLTSDVIHKGAIQNFSNTQVL
jgi:hypothetical protein